jgi:hypothetical protein
MKNKKYKIKKLLLNRRSNKKILLKNPKNGGTPERENKKIVIKKVKKLSKLKELKEYRVFMGLLNTDIIIQKKPTKVKL